MDKEILVPLQGTAQNAPWDSNDNVIWLASTLQIRRNIEKFQFPHKLEIERKKQLFPIISQAMIESGKLQKPATLKAEDLTALERDFLVEQYCIFEGFRELHAGSGFIVDATGQFFAGINLTDHLLVQLTDISGDLEGAWARLMEMDTAVNSSIHFAFSDKFGFLTADPMQCGTAFVVCAFLHLPTLIHHDELAELLEKEKDEAVITHGLQGDPTDLIGDILVVRNASTIGMNEDALISNLRSALLRLMVAEKAARSKVKNGENGLIKDKISRALGMLKSSYQLEAVEALNAISLVKLGIELGYITPMSVREINTLLFTCRRGHFVYQLKEKIRQEELAEKRAAYLREKTAHLTCTF